LPAGEGMISLSNVIKALSLKNRVGKKTIEIKHIFHEPPYETAKQPEDYETVMEQVKQEAAKIRQEAEQYYEEMRQQVLKEKEEWHIEKERLVQLAREEGYRAGFEKGREEALEHYDELIAKARHITELANVQFYEQINASAETILRIGMKAAERIIGEALEKDQNYFLSLVKRVLKEVREQTEVTVYVHPLSYEIVARQKEELKSLFPHEVDLFIHPDDKLQEHACIIETPFGRIDASVDTQLAQIKEKLFERIKEGMSTELASCP
jgi:flagellar assembly protein FliH